MNEQTTLDTSAAATVKKEKPAEVIKPSAEITKSKESFVNQILAQINNDRDKGFVVSPGYPLTNALQEAWLKILGTKDKNYQPATTVCTPVSIANAVKNMVAMELIPSKTQCYFLVYGNELVCMPSYFGYQAVAKSVGLVRDFQAQVVLDGEEIETALVDGREILISHTGRKRFANKEETIKVENIVGAYAVAIFLDGHKEYDFMDIGEVKAAWNKSSNKGQSTHKEFPVKMVQKTVLSRLAKRIFNTTRNTELSAESLQKLTALNDAFRYEENNDTTAIPENSFSSSIKPDFEESTEDHEVQINIADDSATF